MTKVSHPATQSKSEKLTIELMTITPQIAREWVDSSSTKKQRRVNWPHVMYLAGEMKNGNWDVNGQTIQIDEDNDIADGQHRLLACIESQHPFTSFVVFGVPKEAIMTIDAGLKPRGIADLLDIHYKCPNSSVTAAAIKRIYAWELGWRKTVASKAPGNTGTGNHSQRKTKVIAKISPAGVDEFLKKNPGFFGFISEALSIYQSGDALVNKSLFCALLWIIEKENPVYARSFFSKLSNGVNVGETSPVRYLRKKLIEHKMADRPLFTPGDIVAFVVKAFNYYAEGVEVPKMMQMPKEVPEIIKATRA